jgi:hypothetical protein
MKPTMTSSYLLSKKESIICKLLVT